MSRDEVIARALALVVKLAENSPYDLEACGCEVFVPECEEARLIVKAATMLLVAGKEGA